ncbi:MAG: formylglycine-generating enzyme family protein [Bacteroidetes bacterium]|nr:formylglycine-generating enzyme family protein [Bacteroidota bacterium]
MNPYFNNPSMIRKIFITILLCCTALLMEAQQANKTTPEGMVRIPGGTFVMGSNANTNSTAFPAHQVTLPPFFMDIYEVTNKQYHQFCMDSGHKFPEFWGMDIYKSGPDYPDHPVVGVSQFDASEYADWAGKRLPTEAEWEAAARGGLEFKAYPYGEEADHAFARFNDPEAEKGPVKSGSFEANGYGLFDMSGNVWEWVSDWFDSGYYAESPEEDPQGPSTGSFRVLRGGGWHSGPGCSSLTSRNALPTHWVDIAGGFRCVKDLD